MKKLIGSGILVIFTLVGIFTPMNIAEGFGGTDYIGEVKVPGTDEPKIDDSLLNMALKAVNRILGLLSIIAVVICLYAGFLMMTAAGDDSKFKKGQGIIKNAAIGLVIILISRGIVSLVFWFINNVLMKE
ncbi:hypothetical protein AGMMS50249_3070 [candidate division SR1 bacterium]|nr:hypothetical protein AGMMS50249_3070 [candidate division SR1 bacterium]